MGYFVGIDVGTTLTSTAIWRDARVEIVELADDTTTPTPPSGNTAPSARQLSRMLRWVLTKVEEREGSAADGVVVTYPARWEATRVATLSDAIEQAELPSVTTITEPEAAAANYSSMQRIAAGTEIGVYNLGGNRCEVAVLRKTETAWEILGGPDGLDDAAGASFDAAVFNHVMEATDDLDLDDSSVIEAMNRLRLECVRAKEALSSEDEVSIPLEPPLVTEATEVRLTRSELEELVRPRLNESAGLLHRTIQQAGLQPSDLHTVLLIGGSSRIPLVAEVISEELQRPVSVDDHPLHVTAMGAAFVASERAGVVAGEPEAAPEEEPEAATEPEVETASPSPAAAAPPPPPPAPAPAAAAAPPPPKKSRALRNVLVAALVLVVVGAVGIGAIAAVGGSSDDSADSDDPTESADKDQTDSESDDDKSDNEASPAPSDGATALAELPSSGDAYESGTWTIGGSDLPDSLGTAACRKVEDVYQLDGGFSRFEAEVGVASEDSGDANASDETMFSVFADDRLVGREQVRPGDPAVPLQAKLEGASTLRLEIATRDCTEAIAVWGNAQVIP